MCIKPRVSIIVPVYNVEQYLAQSLQSIVEQTYTNLEIIVIDDGSTDASWAIAHEFANKNQRIKLIDQKNQGVAVARNTGLANATGEWVYFVDSDDFIDPQLIEKAVTFAVHEKVDLVAFGYRNISSPVVKRVPEMISNNAIGITAVVRELRHNFLFPFLWNKLYKTKLIKDNQLRFIGKTGEDERFNQQYFMLIEFAALMDNVLYNYRQGRQGSLMQSLDSQNGIQDVPSEMVQTQFNARFPDAEWERINSLTNEFIIKRNQIKLGNKVATAEQKIPIKQLLQLNREVQVKYILVKHPWLIRIWIRLFEK